MTLFHFKCIQVSLQNSFLVAGPFAVPLAAGMVAAAGAICCAEVDARYLKSIYRNIVWQYLPAAHLGWLIQGCQVNTRRDAMGVSPLSNHKIDAPVG
jgi:hypothetical protein